MVLRTVTAINDTITSEESPSQTYSRRPTLTMRSTSGARTFGYLSARGLRSDPRAQVNSAVLRLFAAETAASSTFTVRQVLGKWNPTDLRWGNQPTDPGPVIDTATTALVADQPVDFDVTAEVARWVTSGAPNYGLRLENSETIRSGRSFHSVNATGTKARFRPVLIVDISYPPDRPEGIVPADGATVTVANPVLTWRYGGLDVAPMMSYRVQTNPNDSWVTPAGDTGEVYSTVPQHRLTGLDGTGTWVRIFHKSIEDRWSEPSDPFWINFEPQATVTITSTATVVDDPSPTTTWLVAGGVQAAFQVIYRRVDTGVVVANSGVLTGGDTQWAPASALNVPSGVGVTREVRVWSAGEREATPGAPAYASALSGPFTIEPASTVAVVTDLTASKTPASPGVTVEWSRATTPDSYIVERSIDGGSWKRFPLEVGDVALGGTAYRWIDVTAPAEHDLTYRVRPVVNGSMGASPNEATVRLRASFIWLADPDDPSWVLPLAGNEAGTWAMGEDSTVVSVRGSDRSHVIHEGLRGYEGSVTGSLLSAVHALGDASAAELLERAWRLKTQPTHVWRLAISNMNIPVIVREVNPSPESGAEVWFGLSCSFLQQGELPWVDEDA